MAEEVVGTETGGGAPQLRLAQRVPLGDEIYEALLAQLISLKIPPGARVAVDALVRDLGVSQTPIRAALIRLEAEGLVVRKHNAGFSAAPLPSGERFRETYELRLLLEPAAAAAATRRRTAAFVARLSGLARAMEELAAHDPHATYGKFALVDAEFHALIAVHSGNTLIAEALARLRAHMNLFRLKYHATIATEAIVEHAAILAAVEAGDADAAAEAMRAHITASQRRVAPVYGRLA